MADKDKQSFPSACTVATLGDFRITLLEDGTLQVIAMGYTRYLQVVPVAGNCIQVRSASKGA